MFEYSNLGVGLLGHALARRAGKPYETLLAERILAPLGMARTNFSDEGLATPYGDDGKPVKPWRLSSLAAAGGLRSTVGDMTRFAAALLDPPRPLRPAVKLLLDQPLRPAGGSSRIGLGLLSVPTGQARASTTTAGPAACVPACGSTRRGSVRSCCSATAPRVEPRGPSRWKRWPE